MAPLLFVCALILLHSSSAAAGLLSLAPGLQFSPPLAWSVPSPASPNIVNAYPSPPYGPYSIFAPILSSTSFSSAGKGFSFGFLSVFDHPSNVSTAVHIYLAICIGTSHGLDYVGRGYALPVWLANQNSPLSNSDQGTVRLIVNSQRDLLLTDVDGSVVWGVRGSVASMEVSENGNLVIYNAGNSTLWQSFEDPKDVLVQGQPLPAGRKVVSINSMFAAEMRAGGLLLYMQSSSIVPLAYFLILLNKTVEDNFASWLAQGQFSLTRDLTMNFTGALDSPADPSDSACTTELHERTPYALLAGSNFSLFYGHGCPTRSNVSWPAAGYFQNRILSTLYNPDFIQLDRDGIMRGYTYLNHEKQHYLFSDRQNFSLCFAPNTCGSHGLCVPYAAGQQHYCRCPSSEEDAGLTDAFSQVDSDDPSLGCQRTVPLQCKAGANQTLVRMEGATFISFRAIFEATLSSNDPVSLNDCIQNCAFNCSCSGLYYHAPSSFCLPFSDGMPIAEVSLMSLYTSEYVTYLKVQYASPGDDAPNHKNGNASGSISKRRFLLAFIVVGTIVLGCTIAACAFFMHKRWYRRKQYFIDEKDPEVQEILPTLPTRLSYRELRRATNGFSKVVGKGAFGTVFEGTLSDSRRVAVKRLEMIVPQLKPFLTEVATIGSISHFNIVRLHGYCSERLHRLLVYEFMENGSLDRWLFTKDRAGTGAESSQQEAMRAVNAGSSSTGSNGKSSDGSNKEVKNAMRYKNSFGSDKKEDNKVYSVLSWERRYAIALGTARALAYLHEDSPRPIIHFDVKPENILLDSDFVPKLSDFGLAKLVERGASNVFTLVRGTAGYMAPEWLSHSLVSKKCDVYSYGMVLLELVGGRRNADPVFASTDQWYFPKWAAMYCRESNEGELVDKRLQGVYNVEQVRRIVRVAFLCIHKEPSLRPSMSTVCKLLEGSLSTSLNGKGEPDMEQADKPSLDHRLLDTLAQFDNFQGGVSQDTNTCKSSPMSLYSSIHGR